MNTTTIEERIAGFIIAHEKRGSIPNKQLWLHHIESTLPNNHSVTEDIKKIKHHLQTYPQLTALFCIEYNIALLAKRAAKELGLLIPKDLEIVCFDTTSNRFDPKFEFPFVWQDEQKIGEIAVTKLIEVVKGKATPERILVAGQLIETIK